MSGRSSDAKNPPDGERTGAEQYGGVNQGAPGDAADDDAQGGAVGEVESADEKRHRGPNQGAPGSAPADDDPAP